MSCLSAALCWWFSEEKQYDIFCITNIHCSDSAWVVEGLGVLLQSAAFSGFLLSLVPKLLLLWSGLGWLQSCIYIFIDGERDSSTIYSYMEKIYVNICKNMFFRKEWIIILIRMVVCRLQLKMHLAKFSFAVTFDPFSHLMVFYIFGFNLKFSHVGGGSCWFIAPVWALSLIFFCWTFGFCQKFCIFLSVLKLSWRRGKVWSLLF